MRAAQSLCTLGFEHDNLAVNAVAVEGQLEVKPCVVRTHPVGIRKRFQADEAS